MKRLLIGIQFIPAHGAADLEVMVPAGDWAERSIWRTLATLGIDVTSSYLVRAGERLIVRAKLSEDGGAPVDQARASEVLNALRDALTPRLATVRTIPSLTRPEPTGRRQLTPAA
jgi:hypothetical protein